MTEHKHPDDGGSFGGCSLRAKFAAQFAAAWLPIAARYGNGSDMVIVNHKANELGLLMADDLIRRLRES